MVKKAASKTTKKPTAKKKILIQMDLDPQQLEMKSFWK